MILSVLYQYLSCRFWVKSRGSKWLSIRSELIRDIKKAFDANNINIPFPIMTVEGASDHPVYLGRKAA